MDISKLLPKSDNVLVAFDSHSPKAETLTPGGIILPGTRDVVANDGACYATVVAAGPGHYLDKWVDHEVGTAPAGGGKFIPMNPALKPGARVILDSQNTGDRIWGDDHRELRMVKEHNCIAILEE